MAPRTATAERQETQRPAQQQHPVVAFKAYMDDRMGEVALALPPHMTSERFGRVVLTALQRTPTLLKCTKQSLFNACMMAAQDGLLPDGREGAIVPFADGKADQAQFMPMIEGLRKKARNSGEISNWEVHIVRARDHFEVVLGDNPRIDHKPYFGAEDPGEIIGAYSIAWLKDGTISRDVMTIRDIQKIKNISKAAKGPWSNPTFFPEMCKKTVARRHYKQLPHAAELDEFIKRLDEREGMADDADRIEGRSHQRIASTAAAFDEFSRSPAIVDQTEGKAGPDLEAGDPPAENGDFTAGEFDDDQPQGDAQKPAGEQQQPAEAKAPAKADEPQKEADKPAEPPKQDATAWPLDKEPTNPTEYLEYVAAKVTTFTDPNAIAGWFKGAEERKLRNTNKCNVPEEIWKQCVTVCQERVAELNKAKAN